MMPNNSKMELRFPKARLIAYTKLAGGDSCSSVLISAVTDAGLLSEESAKELLDADNPPGACSSLNTARRIIDAYLCERHGHSVAERYGDATFDQMKADVEKWQKNAKLGHGPDCNDYQLKVSCRDMAPIVLDLLLQQISRH